MRRNFVILAAIWAAGFGIDRLWFWRDLAAPSWDPADYLNGVMNYWQALEAPRWFDGQWWQSLWLLSSKIPPGIYLLTAGFLRALHLEPSSDNATLILGGASALLLLAVYGLGRVLFASASVGLWAAGLCQLLPGLYRYRTEFLLDYPLTAMVTANFCLLAIWQTARRSRWPVALLWGVSFGAALMVKQTTLLFLIAPVGAALAGNLWRRQWLFLAHWVLGFGAALPIFLPWYRTNWLLILTSGKRATLDAAIAEGDPALDTPAAWVYYLFVLPFLVSLPLLVVPAMGWLRAGGRIWQAWPHKSWLWGFLVGGYLLSSLNVNKDARYILPLLPALALLLASGLLHWPQRWQGPRVRWGTIALATGLMACNLFPLGGDFLTAGLSPRVEHHPQRVQPVQPEAIAAITAADPHLQTTLGVLVSRPHANQHNFSFYGTQENFQVFGRQVGTRAEQVAADARSLDWFALLAGEPVQSTAMVTHLRQDPAFAPYQDFPLSGGEALQLYRRRQPRVEVTPISTAETALGLANLQVPARVPPGVAVPVAYEWVGPWERLQNGLVLLYWQSVAEPTRGWLHDRAIAGGRLHGESIGSARVVERTAMVPDADLPLGRYRLTATYLDPQTGQTQAIAVPEFELELDATAPVPPVGIDPDLATQLRALARRLPAGDSELDGVFAEIGRINQYDPRQDYLDRLEVTLGYRLQQQPNNLDWLYALGLSRVLQRDATAAIATFERITAVDAENPYGAAYLAFASLYDLQPQRARAALQPARQREPDLEILQVLDGIAALMQGNVVAAWRNLAPLL